MLYCYVREEVAVTAVREAMHRQSLEKAHSQQLQQLKNMSRATP